MNPIAPHVLQSLVWPDPLHPDMAFTLRLNGATCTDQTVTFEPGDRADLNTAYNAFPLAKWRGLCDLQDLSLTLTGSGDATLTLTAGPWQKTLHLTLNTTVDLTPWLADMDAPLLYVELQARSAATLTALDWTTTKAPKCQPQLALIITTFNRQTAAAATAHRFARYLADTPLAPHLHLYLIDNGQNLTLPPLPQVTVIPNRNLGGAGGFARGLAQAHTTNATHCLFMDDDAAVDITSITRVWTFLAHATDPATSIAGALMRADEPHKLWENGGYFAGLCRPLSRDGNLSDPAALSKVEAASLTPPPNHYGAFWFFAFALEQVRHWPFPYFVRGDDVGFCLTNPFHIITLPGVITYQDTDFPNKETPLVQYLDLRSTASLSLALPDLPRRALNLFKGIAILFLRCLIQCRPESLQALNLALRDVLTGPAYFATHPDCAERRTQLAMRRVEVWHPAPVPLPAPRLRLNPAAPWFKPLMALTLNGLLLPFFGRWGNDLVLHQSDNPRLRHYLGAASITLVSQDGQSVLRLTHSKPAFAREIARMLWSMTRLALRYRHHRHAWTMGYRELASQRFWDTQFTSPK